MNLANEQLYRDLGIFIIHEPSANRKIVRMCPGPLSAGSEKEGLYDPGENLGIFRKKGEKEGKIGKRRKVFLLFPISKAWTA